MKIAILALASLIGTVQTVGWVECCCVLICKHHNNPCKDECKKPEPTHEHDCCSKPARPEPVHEHGKRCSHVEPSSELLSQAADLHDLVPLLAIELPPTDRPLVDIPADAALPAEFARGSPPLLHLLFATLLI
jgi:hypothetical protein